MKDFWNQRYNREDFVYGITPNAFFKQFIDTNKPGKLLLPADGEGRNGVYAALNGWEVDAFDYSKEAKKKALKLADKHAVQLNYTVEDFESVTLPENHYNAVALIYAHMPSDIRRNIHRKIIKSLKTGGMLILEAFSKEQMNYSSGGPRNIDMLYNPEDIKRDFEHLDITYLEQMTIHLDEGEHHQGEGNVIRMIAKKSK
jgi:hypothetical protein